MVIWSSSYSRNYHRNYAPEIPYLLPLAIRMKERRIRSIEVVAGTVFVWSVAADVASCHVVLEECSFSDFVKFRQKAARRQDRDYSSLNENDGVLSSIWATCRPSLVHF